MAATADKREGREKKYITARLPWTSEQVSPAVTQRAGAHSPLMIKHTLNHQRLGREIHCLIIHEEIVRTIPQYNGLPERGHQVRCVCVCLYDKPLVIAFPPNEAEFSCPFVCVCVCVSASLALLGPSPPKACEECFQPSTWKR